MPRNVVARSLQFTAILSCAMPAILILNSVILHFVASGLMTINLILLALKLIYWHKTIHIDRLLLIWRWRKAYLNHNETCMPSFCQQKTKDKNIFFFLLLSL